MVSTKKSSPVEMNDAPYPLRRLPSIEIVECSVGPVSDLMSNINTDESLLLDVFSYTSEQQSSKEIHANNLNEVSSSFNLDSTDSLEIGTHVSMPQSLTSKVSLAISDKSNRIDQEHLDHYYDSDETYLSNKIHADVTDENIRKIDWDKKLFPLMMNL